MLPVANFIADRVSGAEVPPEGRRRTDVRRPRPTESPEVEAAARELIASLPRWRRLSLAVRIPADWAESRR
ncbi:hypothetical protein HJD18_14195 [Thermoleophilia bacterium SCSIO 60948]|nr:hypothetical protein HJD18_14195 [Thermoleophilia bacterium SCSIO 60948]